MRALLWLTLLLVGCDGKEQEDTGAGETGGGDTTADSGADTDGVDADRDADGFLSSVDCDDTRANVNPDVPTDPCNGIDDDCDGSTDEDPDLSWYLDIDGDGFGEPGSAEEGLRCEPSERDRVSNAADCDDDDAAVFPGADEVCDGQDNDCDGSADDDETYWSAFYADVDGDGAGNANSFVYGCDMPADGADNAWDCDDGDENEPVFADPTASSRGSGTLLSPYRSLQSAMNAAQTCVVAFGGTYNEDVSFVGKNITVFGVEGSAATVVDGTGAAPVLTVASGETSARMIGFTLQGGGGYEYSTTWDNGDGTTTSYSWYSGGGAYVSNASLSLQDVVIRDNPLPGYSYTQVDTTTYRQEGSDGGGVYLYNGALYLDDVQVLDNTAYQGPAIYATWATLQGQTVEVSGNSGEYYTIYAYGSDVSLDGFLLSTNTSPYAYSGLYADGNGALTLRNATLVGNDYGVWSSSSHTVDVSSSIVVGNAAGFYCYSGSCTWTLAFNDVWQNGRDFYNLIDPTGNDGNIDVDPDFTAWIDDDDRTNDDLSLQRTSPCIDAGDPDNSRNDADGSINDMGAYGGPEGSW